VFKADREIGIGEVPDYSDLARERDALQIKQEVHTQREKNDCI